MTGGDTEGGNCVQFRSPWGSEMELVSYPDGQGHEKTTRTRLWNPVHPAD